MEDNEPSLFENIQIIALKDFLEPDERYFHRKITRWFATTFHSDIFEVEKQPFEIILQHYFEYSLEQMSKADLEKQKAYVLYKERAAEAEEEDEEFAEALELKYIKEQQEKLNQENKKKQAIPEVLPPNVQIKF